MTAKEDLYNWMVENFEEVAENLFSEVAEKHAKENGWDVVETHFMVEEMVENVKEGILNVIATYNSLFIDRINCRQNKFRIYVKDESPANDMTIQCFDLEDMARYASECIKQGYKVVKAVVESEGE